MGFAIAVACFVCACTGTIYCIRECCCRDMDAGAGVGGSRAVCAVTALSLDCAGYAGKYLHYIHYIHTLLTRMQARAMRSTLHYTL